MQDEPALAEGRRVDRVGECLKRFTKKRVDSSCQDYLAVGRRGLANLVEGLGPAAYIMQDAVTYPA